MTLSVCSEAQLKRQLEKMGSLSQKNGFRAKTSPSQPYLSKQSKILILSKKLCSDFGT